MQSTDSFFSRHKKVLQNLALVLFALVCIAIILYNLRGPSLLKTLESGDFRFELYGKNTVTSITALKDGKEISTLNVSAVLSPEADYGVTVTDLNFDGYPDLTVSTGNSSDMHYCHAWVYFPDSNTYALDKDLFTLPNLTVDPETHSLFSTYLKKSQTPGPDGENGYKTVEGFSVWKYIDGKFREYERRELSYFSADEIWLYSVYTFDFEDVALSLHSKDLWLSPEEGETFTLDTSFDDPLHSPDAPPRDPSLPPEDPAETTQEAADASPSDPTEP